MLSLGGLKENKMEGEGIIIALIVVIGGGIIVYLRERSILTHDYKLKTINDRIGEFIDDSKNYFEPIALASGDLCVALKASKDELLKQEEIPFYWLAKYLCQRDLLRENSFFYFPSEAEEEKVISKYTKLNVVIVSYYISNKEYNAFCNGLAPIDEFKIFKKKINDEVFRKKLCEASGGFSNVVIEPISTAYKPWYEQHEIYINKNK
jgi:hypothetical protein